MADSAGTHSFGTRLFFAPFATAFPLGADPTGAGFTEVAEVISINGVPMNSSVTELTHLQSDDRAKEKIPGILDGGQCNFKLNFTDAGMDALAGVVNGIVPAADVATPDWGRLVWVVQFPSGAQWAFKGFVQGNPFDVPEDNRVTTDVTVEISGRPSFTRS
jgi:hypothetical protein